MAHQMATNFMILDGTKNKQMIKAAQQLLLSTNDSIEDVCYAVGYSNVGYFYKVFRKLCGKPPKAYRQQVD